MAKKLSDEGVELEMLDETFEESVELPNDSIFLCFLSEKYFKEVHDPVEVTKKHFDRITQLGVDRVISIYVDERENWKEEIYFFQSLSPLLKKLKISIFHFGGENKKKIFEEIVETVKFKYRELSGLTCERENKYDL